MPTKRIKPKREIIDADELDIEEEDEEEEYEEPEPVPLARTPKTKKQGLDLELQDIIDVVEGNINRALQAINYLRTKI